MGLARGMILSMARSMAEWAAADRSGVTLHAERCLHRLNIRATCSNCVDVCPVAALALEAHKERREIVLDAEVCVKCGLCTPVCPVGALEGDQGAAELLGYVAQREKRAIVELACALHPDPAPGPPQSSAVVRTRGCLGALGASTIAGLLALDVYHVLLRVDACAACPLGAQARPQIERSAAQVRSLFAPEGDLADPVTLLEAVPEGWPPRPVIAARAPGKTRRDFLRSLATAQEVPAAARDLALEDEPADEQQPPAERRRLLKALGYLSPETFSTEPLAEFPTALLTAGPACNACGVCARACPTGAIGFSEDEDNTFALTLQPGACTDCGVCIDLCEPGALARGGMPALKEWTAVTPQLLRSGTLRHCARCGAPFSGPPQETLCGPCAFRRANPFGSRTPPWFSRRPAQTEDNPPADGGPSAADD